MSRLQNDLSRLGFYLTDSLDDLREASRLAVRISDDRPDDGPVWPAMDDLANKLDVINQTLAGLLAGEIGDTIRQSNAEMDEDEARADAASY